MTFSRILTNICSDHLGESRDVYVALLEFEVNCESDWYVQLRCPANHELELGSIDRTHALGLAIVQEPENEFYSQRRFLTVDPNGCLIDVCSPWSESER